MRVDVDEGKVNPGPHRALDTKSDGYLPHVDGLRAIAVLSVIGFHMGLTNLGGGFVGVDIFFVISGFLIINQIVDGLYDNRFDVWGFYARRGLRILPTYFVVLAVTLVFGLLLLRSPSVLENFALSALMAPAFLTNIFFFAKSQYFDTAAAQKPLLHTWSLSVEEQFYLVVPVLLMGLFWLSRRRGWHVGRVLSIAAVAIGVLSFLGCLHYTPSPSTDAFSNPPNAAFFLTPWRAWEFVAGGLIAAAALGLRSLGPTLAQRLAGAAGIVGVILIGLSVSAVGLIWFGVTTSRLIQVVGYPGYAALLPVAGAFLVILSGLVAPRSPVALLLSLKPVIFVGQISYALYLWAWPLQVFVRLLPMKEWANELDALALIAAVLLSIATRYAIELPILRWRRQVGLNRDTKLAFRIFYRSVAACTVLAIVSGAIGGVAFLMARDNPLLAKSISDKVTASGPCASTNIDVQTKCFDGTTPLGVMVGDSHAMATMPRITYEAEQNDVRLLQMTAPGCNHLDVMLDRNYDPSDIYCKDLEKRLNLFLPKIESEATFAIADGYWMWNMHAPPGQPGTQDELFRLGFRAMMEMLSDNGRRRVLVIGPLPQFSRTDPFNCLELSEILGLDVKQCGISREAVDEQRATTIASMREIVGEFHNARLVDPIDIFCDEQLCMPTKDGSLAFVDDSHLNPFGARLVYERFKDDYLWAFKG